ncbi:hypothetical protein CDAR_305111 [Caerostris darwini]|uniref:Uncharacterized protein n=1 Tax=Caerostris darwini TaxID=1538125 RepID=A0AAV4RC20_9ARAC|nr:hypothetical protein CDAR_305111 [Caerostris darwini]
MSSADLNWYFCNLVARLHWSAIKKATTITATFNSLIATDTLGFNERSHCMLNKLNVANNTTARLIIETVNMLKTSTCFKKLCKVKPHPTQSSSLCP